MTVWVHVDTNKQVADVEHFNVFADEQAAERWFPEHDPEGVAFEYRSSGNRADHSATPDHPSQPTFTCGTDHWATAIG
jgi:hypothetical protein